MKMINTTANLSNLTVIFDNGGGITINAHYSNGGDGNFCHYYDNAKQATDDVKQLLDGESTATWDGHDENAMLDLTNEQIRNGCYRIFDGNEITAQIATKEIESSWINVNHFFRALGCAVNKEN